MSVLEKKEIIEKTDKYVASTYGRYHLALVRGKGCNVYDANGDEYLDFVGGLAVNNLGHCYPDIVTAIKKQAETLLHVSNLYYIEPQAVLASLLVENSFGDKVFFCNSGAEANEAAIKLARKYANDKGSGRFEIVTMKRSFHGRTMAMITATGQEKFQKGFEPLLPGFRYAEFNNIPDLTDKINDKTCAVMLEPIQGEGGVNVPSENYLREVRQICDKAGILLIFDEVQTGMGRTGKLFAYEHYGIEPDIMALAKGLAGGVAMGAMIAKEKVMTSFVRGSHASTFGGNPLACAAGVAAINAILKNNLLKNCSDMGAYLSDRLNNLKSDCPVITEVRGKGLIVGVELSINGADIVAECMKRKVLINCTMDKVLRLLPPIIVTKGEVDKVVDVLHEVLKGR